MASRPSASDHDPVFPYSLTLDIPFPTKRLAGAALRSLKVDQELSTLVRRDFSLHPAEQASSGTVNPTRQLSDQREATLKVHYTATTPRMLRVAVNGFFESLGVVIQVMEELDVDVLHEKGFEGLEGVQGVEQGLTGIAGGAAR